MTLTSIEARVLATLMEKARTVADSYPLTLNALLLGCNQKSSREPVMEIDEGQIATAIDALKTLGLVRENTSGRSARFEHNFQRGVGVPEQSAVLLGLLMLRGPQTAGELRLNRAGRTCCADRWTPHPTARNARVPRQTMCSALKPWKPKSANCVPRS